MELTSLGSEIKDNFILSTFFDNRKAVTKIHQSHNFSIDFLCGTQYSAFKLTPCPVRLKIFPYMTSALTGEG